MTLSPLLLLFSIASQSVSPAVTAPATPAPPAEAATTSTALPAAIVGTWELDHARSDDPGPLLERLGVPWLFRVLAPKVVQQEIILEPGRVHIRVSGQSRDEVLTIDGKTPARTELVGHPLVLVSRVEGDAIVSEGTVTIDGVPLAVRSVRRATAREMHVTNTFGTGPGAVVFRRVFLRVTARPSTSNVGDQAR